MNRRAAPVAGIAFRMAQIKRDSEESGDGYIIDESGNYIVDESGNKILAE